MSRSSDGESNAQVSNAAEETANDTAADLHQNKEDELPVARQDISIRIEGEPTEVHENHHGEDEEQEPTEDESDSQPQAPYRDSSAPAVSQDHVPPSDGPSVPQSPAPQSVTSSAAALQTAPPSIGSSLQPRPSSAGTVQDGRRSSSVSGMVFVTTALESIAASKEARKKKQLGEATQVALTAIKQDTPMTPETVFEPLRLATETTNIQLATTALDCIGKLITYSYFSTPASESEPGAAQDSLPIPLIERAIDTICDCFQDEATSIEIQLQIVKSLLAAVLNDKTIVHGAGLLKAVRQVYNIFLLSKSPANQQVAQGTLTQMVGTVFERVKSRLASKEARLNMSKMASERGTASGSHTDLTNGGQATESAEVVAAADGEAAAGEPAGLEEDKPVSKEPGEKMTLESFENQKNFDDTQIGDNAPTLVTQGRPNLRQLRTASSVSTQEEPTDDEEAEDEIFVRDAYLVFRSMCRLSMKVLPQEQLQDLRSQHMRTKLISLAIIRTIINNNMEVFTSPLVVIRGNSETSTSFGQAVIQYLRLSLSRNGPSSVRQVFEVGCEIFWLMLKGMRVMLKRELEVFFKEIYLAILDRRNAPGFQKLYIMKVLRRLSYDPKALVEIYLNYDCDRSALDNMFQRTIEHLARMSSAQVAVSPQQQQAYQEQFKKEADSDADWYENGKMPPPLSTSHLIHPTIPDADLPVDFVLKQQSLECLVRILSSLMDWAQDSIATTASKYEGAEPRASFEDYRQSLERSRASNSPRLSAADTPVAPSTPLLEDDPSQFERAKQRKTALLKGIREFNFKPKRGIKTLVENGFIKDGSPEEIAAFIITNDQLDKAMIGEYLGDGDAHNVAIMHAFVDSMEFAKRRFVDSLRQFLQSFRLPGEAQKIDRFMLKFAERYMAGNPNAFANADTAYVLAYSVIMLNTDQHSLKLKGPRMTKEDFVKNNRGINDNADLPDEYLHGIFEEIAHHEIVLTTEREHAAALGIVVPSKNGGIGSSLFSRDLEREAALQADQEMSSKAEQRLRSMLKAQKKLTASPSAPKYVPATSFKHIGPMFDVTWMSFLSAFSAQMQMTQNLDTIKLCMQGLKLAIRVSCLFDLETPRVAFVTSLANLTNLSNPREMMAKNLEALRVLLEVAHSEGNMLKGSWTDVLTCVSQLDRLQLISGGVDEEVVPDVRRTGTPQAGRSVASRGRGGGSRRPRPALSQASQIYQSPEIAYETRSTDMIKAVDRIFTGTAELSGEAIVHFVRALSDLSWQEIQSSGSSESPRTYSLQKLVEISYYNMTRVRFEWANIWQVLGEHFNEVGCLANTNVVYFALDSLRQLSMRFMELEELPGFKFQKDFLKPFEHIMANSAQLNVKDMVLRCLIQMLQARGENIRSGWKTMFGVFTVAAKEQHESLVNLAYEQASFIYNNRFGVVISQGAFADLVVCLTEFSKNLKFQKKSLQAIETLRATVPKMLKTPECPLSNRSGAVTPGMHQDNVIVSRYASRQTQEEQFWFPVLFAFHDVLMTGEDLEVRSQALNYLFDILIKYGGDFPSEFWDILWRQLLYPIFMVLKSKSEMSKVVVHEDLSVWLSTTMIQALRNMISLFTHYFESLEYMLDRFLDLLGLCICQENDTIARIGSNCLQTLILQNVGKFRQEHWHQIVSAFVELFERTTAYQLFTAASNNTYMADESGRRESKMQRNDLDYDDDIEDGALKAPSIRSGGEDANGHTSDFDTLAEPQQEKMPVTPPDTASTTGTEAELEDYKPQPTQAKQPLVVSAAKRKFFNKIITRCVLQLLMIETVNELFSNNEVYTHIPSYELLRLMALLKKSYSFAKKFNNDKDLRMRLWHDGFMKQPPNLLKQESGSAATYVNILVRMYFDESEERRRSRAETETALVPLCADIIRSYVLLDEETQHRNIVAWRPVVVDVMEGYINFPREDFERHIETFYPLVVDLLNREMSVEIRLALQALLRRVGEAKFGMDSLITPSATPTSPKSVSSAYFHTRRSSRVSNVK